MVEPPTLGKDPGVLPCCLLNVSYHITAKYNFILNVGCDALSIKYVQNLAKCLSTSFFLRGFCHNPYLANLGVELEAACSGCIPFYKKKG